MPVTRYGIRRPDGLWLALGNKWASNPIAAKWFQSATDAHCAALRDLPGCQSYTVEPIPLGLPVKGEA